jgi:hypothetical protein
MTLGAGGAFAAIVLFTAGEGGGASFVPFILGLGDIFGSARGTEGISCSTCSSSLGAGEGLGCGERPGSCALG